MYGGWTAVISVCQSAKSTYGANNAIYFIQMGQENMLDNGDMYVMVVVKLNCLNLEIVFVPALDAAIYIYLQLAIRRV